MKVQRVFLSVAVAVSVVALVTLMLPAGDVGAGLQAVQSVSEVSPARLTKLRDEVSRGSRAVLERVTASELQPSPAAFEPRFPELGLEDLGPLSSKELARVKQTMLSAASGNQARLDELRAHLDPNNLDQLIQEASLLTIIAERLAEAESLDLGRYVTCKSGHPVQQAGLSVYWHNPAELDGNEVDVVIPVVIRNFPQVVKAREYERFINDFRLQRIADDFNGKGDAERMQLYQKNREALQELSRGCPPELAKDDGAAQAWKQERAKYVFPSGVRVDPVRYLMLRE
jgi:hypothetical protein